MEKYDIIRASDLYSKKEINSILYSLTKGISLDSFTVRGIEDSTAGYPTACCYGNGKFFVGTDAGEVFSFSFRTPGQEYTYSRVQLPSKVDVEDLAYGDGVLMVSMLRGSLFAKSTDDGQSFTEFTVQTVNTGYSGRGGAKICYAGDGLFIAACSVAGGLIEILHGVNFGETWYLYQKSISEKYEASIGDISWGRKLRNGYDPVEGCIITVYCKAGSGTLSVSGNLLKQNITNYENYGNYWKWSSSPVGSSSSYFSVCYNNFLDKWVLTGEVKSADAPNACYADMDTVVSSSLDWFSDTGFIGEGTSSPGKCIASTDSSYDTNGVDTGKNWNLIITGMSNCDIRYSRDLASWSAMTLTNTTTDCRINGIAYGDRKFFMCIDATGIIETSTPFWIAYADFFVLS